MRANFFILYLRASLLMSSRRAACRQSEKELREKHPEEFERLQEQGKLPSLEAPVPQRWLENFGRVVGGAAIIVGFVLLWLTVAAFLKG